MKYFITENYLKDETPITANCDATDIVPWIKPAAEIRIKPILGNLFFKDLLTKYNAESLNEDEIELVLLIQPCVAWRAAAMTVYSLSRQLKNKGLQIQNGENSEGVTLNEVTFGMDHYGQISKQYEGDLIEWLVENKNTFPVLMSAENKGSKVKDICNASELDEGFNDSILFI
jgi:hypothetical protein